MTDPFPLILQQYQNSGKICFLILIGGCSRTGKSTLAQTLQERFIDAGINAIIVKLDNWLLGIDERTGNETVRERFKYPEIIDALTSLMNRQEIFPPFYDPKTRLVVQKKGPHPLYLESGICIVDGVVALDIPDLRELADFKIYLEIPDEIRKSRLVDFYTNYKNCTPEETEKIIEERELEEVMTVKETRIYADMIFDSNKQKYIIPRKSK
jgi:uridine kinase